MWKLPVDRKALFNVLVASLSFNDSCPVVGFMGRSTIRLMTELNSEFCPLNIQYTQRHNTSLRLQRLNESSLHTVKSAQLDEDC